MAMAMASGAGFILCGYEVIRTTANTLFVSAYGKAALPLGIGLVPVGVSVVLYVYGRLLSRLGPRRTLAVTTLLAMLTMGLCYLGIRLGVRLSYGLLYVFKESYVVLLIEQYWSYIDSMLHRDSARRLNGPICAVASVGAIGGGELLYRLSTSWGTLSMVLVAAVVTLPGLFIGDAAYRRFGEPPDRPKSGHDDKDEKSGGVLRLDLFRKQRILLVIVGVVASAQLVAAMQELLFQGLLQDHFPNPDARNAVSGQFYKWLNAGALFFQLVMTPLVLRFVPYSVIHLVIPCVHIGTLVYALLSPSSLVRVGASYFMFKALDYSLFRAAKELLYVPLSFDVRYRAKEIIDVFGYRVSKGAASLSINLLQQAGIVFSSPTYALIGIAGSALWFVLVLPITRYSKT
jgi:AAA family ATP:ADP antiporter